MICLRRSEYGDREHPPLSIDTYRLQELPVADAEVPCEFGGNRPKSLRVWARIFGRNRGRTTMIGRFLEAALLKVDTNEVSLSSRPSP